MDVTPTPSDPVEEEWPQCETCGHFLLDFTEVGGSWDCTNPKCPEGVSVG